MKNKIIMAMLSATLLFTLAGCGNDTTNDGSQETDSNSAVEEQVDIEDKEEVDNQDETEDQDQEVGNKEEEKITEEDKTIEKDKSNEEDLEQDTRDEKDEDVVQVDKTSQKVKLYFSDDQAENLIEKEAEIKLAKGDNLEEKVLESLRVKPEGDNINSVVRDDIKFNGVVVQDKIARVDISSDNLNGGSAEEMFLVDGIVSALTSLDSVDEVKFLVDGEDTQSLMGHIDVIHPWTKSDVTSNIMK